MHQSKNSFSPFFCPSTILVLLGTFFIESAGATTSCEVQLSSCPSYPSYSNSLINDNYNGSGSDSGKCMSRAAQFQSWCNSSTPVVAKYIQDGSIINSTSVGTGCLVQLSSCPNFPDHNDLLISDPAGTSDSCVARASAFKSWCGTTTPVSATFYPYSGTQYKMSEYWENPTGFGTTHIFDNSNSGTPWIRQVYNNGVNNVISDFYGSTWSDSWILTIDSKSGMVIETGDNWSDKPNYVYSSGYAINWGSFFTPGQTQLFYWGNSTLGFSNFQENTLESHLASLTVKQGTFSDVIVIRGIQYYGSGYLFQKYYMAKGQGLIRVDSFDTSWNLIQSNQLVKSCTSTGLYQATCP